MNIQQQWWGRSTGVAKHLTRFDGQNQTVKSGIVQLCELAEAMVNHDEVVDFVAARPVEGLVRYFHKFPRPTLWREAGPCGVLLRKSYSCISARGRHTGSTALGGIQRETALRQRRRGMAIADVPSCGCSISLRKGRELWLLGSHL